MKITFVLPYAGLEGGIRVLAIYAKKLAERGHDVFVVSQPLGRPTLRDQVRSIVKHRRWKRAPRPHESHFYGLSVPHRVLECKRPVCDHDVPDADVIVATWWLTAEWVANLSPKKGAKAYFIQHHEVFDYAPKDRVRATWRLPMHKITISKWLVDLAREEYGDTDVSWVPNSVDMTQFHAPPRGRQPNPTVGLLYSNLGWKGCATSLAAFAQAAEKIPTLSLTAFGTSPPVDGIPLPPRTKFHLRPPQDRLKDIYASCDVWLCGSQSEGFHLPILEAMACRCPVVSTAVGGSVDAINHGVNGFIVPVGDTQGLANGLIELFSIPESQWKSMSDAAYNTAISYSWDDATAKFEDGLRLAIERRRAGVL